MSSLYLQQVDEGVVMYEHLHADSTDWSEEDFFIFTVSSPPSVLDIQMFHVVISYEIDRHDQNSNLVANTGKNASLFHLKIVLDLSEVR